jgi:hypothetical protein
MEARDGDDQFDRQPFPEGCINGARLDGLDFGFWRSGKIHFFLIVYCLSILLLLDLYGGD